MMRTRHMLVLAGCALTLAACGSRQVLTRPNDPGSVPVAYGEKERESAEQMMDMNVQARPDRSAEPLKRSVKRDPDPFDLPPE